VAALSGRTALVTGGGRGIGRVGREGARVAVAARTAADIDAVARECGAGVVAIPLDEAACDAAVERAERELGRQRPRRPGPGLTG
jgi:NAD(P)-dependent dehydrogenase (short-subunit alcohol dehydrogenase family)